MSERKEKVRKVFSEILPKWENGRCKGQINWTKSIGYKVKFIYDDIEGELDIIDYESKGRYLYIKYLNKELFKIQTDGFINCHLGKLLNKHTSNFKVEIGQVFKDGKRDLIITDREYRQKLIADKRGNYISNKKYYQCKCNKCNWTKGWIEESNILRGIGCSCCHGFEVVEGINDISTTAPWMIPYFQGGIEEARLYSKGSSKGIFFKCPDCGRIKCKKLNIKNLNSYHSIGCSCGDGKSYGEKLMFNILEQIEIDFEIEYSPDWVKPKRYDFYFELNNEKYIVETDGCWHKKDNNRSGQTKEESKHIDDYKDKLANENGIEVIRIDCGNIELIQNNIFQSNLSDIFDLTNIDWLKAEEFAYSNLVKVACEYKINNPKMTTIDIGKIMKLHSSTINKYLKVGTKLGWCSYDAKEENSKSSRKNGKMTGKSVEIFKEGISLGVFESGSELERQSEKLFGITLIKSNISLVCNGKRNHHQGYTFKYVENLKELDLAV